jgi:hypothetical protein
MTNNNPLAAESKYNKVQPQDKGNDPFAAPESPSPFDGQVSPLETLTELVKDLKTKTYE